MIIILKRTSITSWAIANMRQDKALSLAFYPKFKEIRSKNTRENNSH